MKKKRTELKKNKHTRKLLKNFGSTGNRSKNALNSENVKFTCLQCGKEELIPTEVVEHFDFLDDGDPSEPPRFNCEECDGEMIPEYFVSHTGIVYDNRTKN